jgi:SAM-dependent methyltransferase
MAAECRATIPAAFDGAAQEPMNASGEPSQPSRWIVRFSPLIADDASVLDVAAGGGRHSRWFAARGCRVVAVDRDPAAIRALSTLPGVEALHADLEAQPWPFGGRAFDAIVVTHYLHRALFPHLLSSLASDGVLLYETFAHGNELYGKPSNPDFLLQEAELLSFAAKAMTIVAFEQGRIDAGRPAVVQRLAAVGRGRTWPPQLAT